MLGNFDFRPSFANQAGEGLSHLVGTLFSVDQGEVQWDRGHHQHSQRQVHGDGRDWGLHGRVADQGRLGRDSQKCIFLGIEEEFPG